MERRLQLLERKTERYRRLETRIKNVCNGHIRWLQKIRNDNYDPTKSTTRPPWNDEDMTNEHIIQAGCFAANYWVTGKVMTQDSETWQPPNRITDTAFHILKLAEYKSLFPESKEVQTTMNDIYVPWLTELDRLDICKAFSWPYSNMDRITKFRLDDHFWIWKALRYLDAAVTKVRLPPRKNRGVFKENQEVHKVWLQRLYTVKDIPTHDDDLSQLEGMGEGESEHAHLSTEELEGPIRSFMTITKRLSPNNLHRAVLQRFTAVNDVMKPARRMLAVTRSAMDMRFLLHARDTALFYGEECGFFIPGGPFTQLWQNTIDAQLHHEENMFADSDNTLRYALGIAMGVQHHRLSRTSNASETVKRSVRILIGAGGSDAFFPGQLDDGAREPTIFEEEKYRDHFYHAGFEINYILLSCANKIDDIFSKSGTSLAVESRDEARRPVGQTPIPLRQPGEAGFSDTYNMLRVPDTQPEVVMKKLLPFTNAIPATNVNYIGDEWLYRYPDFLRGRLEISGSDLQRVLTDAAKSPKIFVASCHRVLDNSISDSDSASSGPESQQSVLHVVDIRKGKQNQDKSQTLYNNVKNLGPKSRRYTIHGIENLCDLLKIPRTAWTAKKRMIWLPDADDATVKACLVFSTERERSELSRFFERHALYTKDVMDETSMVLNGWQTELHLNFYMCSSDSSAEAGSGRGLPRRDQMPLPIPSHTDLQIRRASMSFRFDGDIFDRFWTCYVIDYMPLSGVRWKWDHEFDVIDGNLDNQWSQRKVLELCFLKRILEKMNEEANRFQKEIRTILKIEPFSLQFSSTTSETSSMKYLQQFEKILELVEEDLTANLSTLREKWNRRETDRGAEKPRWTANDEKKYRANINKLGIELERATGKLQANQDGIRKLKEFLATSRKSMKSEMDRARNEKDRLRDADIRYLTYVTVIFQPLGFAASFYSMAGAPEPGLIVSLVEFSTAAFAVTIMLIWIYRAFASRHDKDGVLQVLAKKSIEQHSKSRTATEDRNPRITPQIVVNRIGGVIEQIVHYILTVIRWCWGTYRL